MNKRPLVVFVLVFSVLFIWFLSFYPGILVTDSMSQWSQAVTKTYQNWHPPFYAFLMTFGHMFIKTPVFMTILQITLYSIAVALILNFIADEGTNLFILLFASILFIFWPPTILNVMILKDSLYTTCVLFAAYFAVRYIKSNYCKNYLYIFSINILVLMLIRFNGILFLPLIPLLWFQSGRRYRELFVSIFLFIILFFSYSGIELFAKVEKTEMPFEQVRMRIVASSLHNSRGLFTPKDINTLNDIQPLSNWINSYTCVSADPLTFNSDLIKQLDKTDWKKINSNGSKIVAFHNLFNRTLQRDFGSVVKDRACYAKNLLVVDHNQYLYRAETEYFSFFEYFPTKPKFNNKLIVSYLKYSSLYPQKYIFWPSLFFSSVSLAGFIIGFFCHRKEILIVSVMSLISLIGIIVLAPATDFRYIYVVMLLGIFQLLLLFTKEKL